MRKILTYIVSLLVLSLLGGALFPPLMSWAQETEQETEETDEAGSEDSLNWRQRQETEQETEETDELIERVLALERQVADLLARIAALEARVLWATDSPETIPDTVPQATPIATPAPTPEIIDISAQDLADAYDDDDRAADTRYKHRWLRVTGVIDDVDDSKIALEIDGWFNSVDCHMRDALIPPEEWEGYRVTLIGIGDGRDGSSPQLDDCRVSSPPKPSFVLDAKDLIADYQSNTLAAEQEYQGKWLMVSGIVDSVDSESKTRVVTLGTGEAISFFTVTVRCAFPPNYEENLLTLSKGQPLTVHCLGDEASVMDTPQLKACTIWPQEQASE